MKKFLVFLLVLLLIAVGAMGGYAWYRTAHIFVEDAVYAKNSESMDLRGQDISQAHFDTVRAQLPDTPILWDVPFQGGKVSSDAASLTLTALTQEDIDMLRYFPELTSVDAMGCQDYPMIEALMAAWPELEVSYQVTLGATAWAPDTPAVSLSPEDFTFETLMKNLPHLPLMENMTFLSTTLEKEQILELQEAFPEIAMTFTLELLGEEYDAAITELDLSAITPDQVEEAADRLPLFPSLQTVTLNDADGKSNLAPAEVKLLSDAIPDATIVYTFQFYGVTISTTDTEVKLYGKRIGDAGEGEVRTVLDIMESCNKFTLDSCRISNAVMAQLREDYRDKGIKLVWRVYFGGGGCLTDAEIIRVTYDLEDDNCHDLVYCEDVRYIDFGHNEFLDTVDFVAGMPNLEFIIISGAPIKDLTPFQNCKKLRILEAAFCHYLTDISPLASCESLQMLNIARTQVTDLSPLDELNMTHMTATEGKVPQAERDRFALQHPDCLAKYGGNPYGTGWRYETEQQQMVWYSQIADIFQYPHAPNNTGWYLTEEQKQY